MTESLNRSLPGSLNRSLQRLQTDVRTDGLTDDLQDQGDQGDDTTRDAKTATRSAATQPRHTPGDTMDVTTQRIVRTSLPVTRNPAVAADGPTGPTINLAQLEATIDSFADKVRAQGGDALTPVMLVLEGAGDLALLSWWTEREQTTVIHANVDAAAEGLARAVDALQQRNTARGIR